MSFNAFVLDWTMDDYSLLKQKLAAAGFQSQKVEDAEHIRVVVPFGRVDEFAALCQAHLNAPFNYIDVQFPAYKQTVIIFAQTVFLIDNLAENERVRQWAIALGLPPEQADWPTSF